jgi:hypothetical protein
MAVETYVKRTRMPFPAEAVWNWHARPGAFERLAPPWEAVRVVERRGGIEDGARVVLQARGGRWVVELRDVVPGVQFRDVQVSGPFRRWDHVHRMEPDGDGCVLEDRIEYELPLGDAGRFVAGSCVRREIERLFEHRHRLTAEDLAAHAGARPLRVRVTGASGLVGSALLPFLAVGGHEATGLGRDWTPADLEGADAVVHLAGENIGSGRWTAAKKARIWESRVHGTRRLARALAAMARPPRILVSASAVGIYGDRPDEVLSEGSAPGHGFLAEVCREWEAATEPAARAGLRVVRARLGVVLSPKGGALARMLTPFKLGLGGRIGSGGQGMSWIGIEDLVDALRFALQAPGLEGAVNVVAPEPVTNAEFSGTLARVLKRPAIFPMPAFAARLAFGEMAQELLLSGQHAIPSKLLAAGHRFRHPRLEDALRALLGR